MTSLSETSWAIALAEHEAACRTEPERHRRFVLRLTDQALEECEQLNLRRPAGGWPAAPLWVAALIEHLQAVAGRELRRPQTSLEAHGLLLGDLQAGYFRRPAWVALADAELEAQERAARTLEAAG